MVNSVLSPKVYMALGLAGETGETVEVVKKSLRDNGVLKLENLKLELGDVLYYWVRLCQEYELDPHDVMDANKTKLVARMRKD